jgi:hypothetical protein
MIPGPWQIGQQRRIVGGLTACFPADYCLQLQARRRALSIQVSRTRKAVPMVTFAGMIGAQNGETVWHRTKVVRQIGLAAVPNIRVRVFLPSPVRLPPPARDGALIAPLPN